METRNSENLCEKHNCSECCNPVKVKEGFAEHNRDNLKDFPFRKRDEVWIPHESVDGFKLEVYDCDNFDKEKGKCKDYENRPMICKDTFCNAYSETDESKQKEIIDNIKREGFVKCKK